MNMAIKAPIIYPAPVLISKKDLVAATNIIAII